MVSSLDLVMRFVVILSILGAVTGMRATAGAFMRNSAALAKAGAQLGMRKYSEEVLKDDAKKVSLMQFDKVRPIRVLKKFVSNNNPSLPTIGRPTFMDGDFKEYYEFYGEDVPSVLDETEK